MVIGDVVQEMVDGGCSRTVLVGMQYVRRFESCSRCRALDGIHLRTTGPIRLDDDDVHPERPTG